MWCAINKKKNSFFLLFSFDWRNNKSVFFSSDGFINIITFYTSLNNAHFFSGGFVCLGKMIGGISCGFVSRCIGYRNALIFVNIPQFLSFYLFYYSSSVWMILIATFLLGFGCGFIKAPCSSYVTEISETKVRGILLFVASISMSIAPLLIFVLGNLTTWRNIAFCWCIIQAITTIALFCVSKFCFKFLASVCFVLNTIQLLFRFQNHHFFCYQKSVKNLH